MSVSKTITELVEYLNVCRDAYYNKNTSIITDEQYDDLFDKLKQMEDDYGIILTNSPTQTVGYEVKSNLEKVEHKYPLLSLDKTKSYDDVMSFCESHSVLFMYKVDGLTCQLTYVDGKLVRAETRGDGIVGEDITHNARTFIGVPETIPYDGEIRITGEAVINRKDFIYVNEQLGDIYKNPRNLASGSARQLDSSICAKRKVRFIVWNANDLTNDDSMSDGLFRASEIGFTVVHHAKLNNIKSTTDIETLFTNMKNHTKIDFIPIDGIVAMYDSISYGNSLGRTAYHFKNGLAFKFYDDSYETTLSDVEFTIGKTGVLTPTAVFDPVDIDGTTVTRASVHNISILKNLNLCVGDSISVYKSNEIIPQIRCNNTKHYNPDEYKKIIPNKCPYCNSDTQIVKNDDSDVYNLYCTNKDCSGVLLKKFSAFVSKQALNIDGLSEKTLEKFIKLGYLKTYSDIYTLCNKKSVIMSLDGFGEKSVDSLMKSIEQSKHTTLDRLLIGLNIDGVGKQTAKDIATFFNNNTNEIRVEVANLNRLSERLKMISGLGDVVSKSFVDWFSNSDNYNEFNTLCTIMTIQQTVREKSSKLAGLKFVITGKLNKFTNRDELVNTITLNGGEIQSSVSRTTNFLINNDVTSQSSKNKKAKELGIEIVDEQYILDLLDLSEDKQESIKECLVKKRGLF